ncbi:fimbrial protein [Serratia quinivorans]|uniref:fimbrial protein n=1 Tax=Serratia quinivorans TaxID=137545 RepID=UPI0021BB750E|nr:fimbrial protein [Serratia quinivorans]
MYVDEGVSTTKNHKEKQQMRMTKANQIKWWYLRALLILAGLGSQPTWALNCSPINTSITINVGNITVQKDVADMATLTPIITSTSSGYDCKYDGSSLYVGAKAYGTDTGKLDGSRKIFASNVAGMGFTIGATSLYSMWVGSQGFGSGNAWVLVSGFAPQSDKIIAMTANIELFKTGELSSGTLSGKIGALIIGNNPSPTVWGSEIPINITGTVTKVACSLTNTTISVPLGDVQSSAFNSISATAGDKTFNLGLSCDKDANINVALAGTQNMDTADTSVLALTNAGQSGTAKGVGVQLLYGGVPLKLNNNILLKTSVGGQETLPFSARYYQTQTAIGAGLANSSATLNITYQ